MFSAAKISSPTSSGYNLTRSLRFRASASAYLQQTPAADSSRTTWTYSTWIKRGQLGTRQSIFACYDAANTRGISLEFQTNNQLDFYVWGSFLFSISLQTNQTFTDPSAWYHIVLAVDTTQSTSSNTIKLYVNGGQITSFSIATYPAQNSLLFFSTGTIPQLIGQRGAGSFYFDGYSAETNFVTGLQLTPSSFGSFNALTGVWQPAKYTGTYGTNGFYLPFTDNSALTTSSNVGLGKDFSGNGNYWTTNNISITAGVTYDSMTDVPTLTSATAANFAVLNPIGGAGASLGINSGNLQWNYTANSNINGFATVYMPSGKWYIECIQTGGASSDVVLGFETAAFGQPSATALVTDTGYFGYTYAGRSWNFGTNTNGNPTLTVNTDVMNFAIDITSGKAWVGKNGTWFGSGNPATGANPWWTFTANTAYTFAMAVYNAVGCINFGQQPFTYTPPTGFVALNTYNLPTGTILQGNKVMDATLYTGNGATGRLIANAAPFKPDLVWIKARSAAYNNNLYDSVRGAPNELCSNNTAAEVSGDLTAFNTTGFTVNQTASFNINESGTTYVGWQWQAGQGSSSSNTNGTITSTVSVNASAGFSVVTYTGQNTAGTIGHGLSVAPQFIIVKSRTGASNWIVYSYALAAPTTSVLLLNSSSAVVTGAATWNSTNPTSSVFSLIGNDVAVNQSGSTYVAYCWAEIAGFSKFGSYTGNGSADGTFVYTGFRPKFVMVKNTANTYDWILFDTTRNPYNVTNLGLRPDTSGTETGDTGLLILSNGFKWSNDTGQTVNQSGALFVYMAFAENPTKYALAR